jgi:hypothetical protein
MKKFVLATAFFAMSVSASAQAPQAGVYANAEDYPLVEVFGGWSFIKPSLPSNIIPGEAGEAGEDLAESILGTVMGWGASGNLNVTRNFGITLDFSGHYRQFGVNVGGDFAEATASIHTFLIGPSFSSRHERVTVFGHALFGAGHVAASASADIDRPEASVFGTQEFSENGFAASVGGGVDVNAHPMFAIRAIELDYFPYRNSTGDNFTFNNFRWRTGLVGRF